MNDGKRGGLKMEDAPQGDSFKITVPSARKKVTGASGGDNE